MSDAEMSFRNQKDYISKYRRVLEHFDAVKIGLTATPALHTDEIFGEPIFKAYYSYREAVIDGYWSTTSRPYRIMTALAEDGIEWKAGERWRSTTPTPAENDLVHVPDELRFDVEEFNRRSSPEKFNRVVSEELAKHIDPALTRRP